MQNLIFLALILVDTGQTECYGNIEKITCPANESDAFYGQDA